MRQRTRIDLRCCGRIPYSVTNGVNYDENCLSILRSHAIRGHGRAQTMTRMVYGRGGRKPCGGAKEREL